MKDPFAHLRQQMVEYQIARRGVADERVLDAMCKVPRHLFVPPEYTDEAYDDHPLPIGSGQTISQPYIVAFMTEQLALQGDENVLEVGTGSGYQAAVLAQLVRKVHTIERVPELANLAVERFKQLKINNIQVHIGDGSLGWPPAAPYQAILVTAAAPDAPQALLDQLALGGRLIVPVGERFHQNLELWRRDKDGLHYQNVLPVMFVPLMGEQGWNPEDPQP